MEDGLQRWIEFAIESIHLLKLCAICSLRHYALGDPDDSIACGVCRGPNAGTHAGEQRSTVRSAFLGCNHFDRLAVNVGLNLPPDGRAPAAAPQPYGTRRDADLGEDAHGVVEAEGDSLHDGANDV